MGQSVPVTLEVLANVHAGVKTAFDSLKSQTATVSKETKILNSYMREFGSIASGAALKAGLSMEVFGAVLAGATGGAIKMASGFEDLQVRLKGITKDGDAANKVFEQSVALGGLNAFPVASIVEAATQLTIFRQNVQQTLPIVLDFAAAMHEDIPKSATLIGQALEGNAKAFKALGREADIGGIDLKQFGGELDKSGKAALGNQVALDKNREALKRLLASRYGGAAAEQAETLSGSLVILQNNLKTAADSFGNVFVPAATAGVKTVAYFAQEIGKVPDWIKGVAAAGVTGAIGLSVFGGAALIAGSQVLSMAVNVASLVARFPVLGTAISQVAGFLTGALAPAITAVGSSLLAAAPYLAAFTALLIAGEFAIHGYEEATKELDATISAESKAMIAASSTAHSYADIINGAVGNSIVTLGASLEDTKEDIKTAFSAVPPEKMVAALEKAGVTVDGLKRKLQEQGDQAKTVQTTYDKLKDALAQPPTVIQSKGGGLKQGVALTEELAKMFEGRLNPTIDEVKAKLAGMDTELLRFGQGKAQMEAMRDVLTQFAEPLQKAADEMKEFNTYTDFAAKAKDLKSMIDLEAQLGAQLRQRTAEAAAQGLPTKQKELIQQLQTATGVRKEFILGYLKLLEQETAAKKRHDEYSANGEKEVITQMERRREKELALSAPVTTTKGKIKELENEKSYIDKELALVHGASAKELELTKQLNAAKGTDKEAKLAEQLATARGFADKEVGLEKRKRETTGQLVQERVKDAKEGLTSQVQDLKENIEKVGSSEDVTQVKLAATIKASIIQLQAYGKVHKELFSNPESRAAFRADMEGLTKQFDATKKAIPVEQMTKLRQKMTEYNTDAVTTPQKLAAVQKSLALLNEAQAHLFTSAKARAENQTEINKLTHEEVKLQVELTKERQLQANETRGIQLKGLEQEIQLLKQKQTLEGKNLGFEIQSKEKQVFAGQLKAIYDQAQAERDAGVDRAEVAARTESRITQFKQAEVLKRIEAENSETKSATESVDKILEARRKLEGLKSNRLGGAGSPLQSLEEVGLESSIGFGTAAGDFDARARSPKVPKSVSQIQAQVDRDLEQGDRDTAQADKAKAKAGKGTASYGAKEFGQGAMQQTNYITVGSHDLSHDPDVIRDARQLGKTIDQKLGNKKRQFDARNGPGSAELGMHW